MKFTHADFDRFIPWLDQHRGELSVLVHADTGDNLADHTTHACWLDDAVELDLRMFR
ncbi:DOPA 4,5-dioxygenase family protein [Oceanimonas marisflavi]|uniref:DOPA 4,5-dioxygenase family protein n=1 Tax=Oceanimonas marisflavi TaxID=2059724 RepID=UPI001E47AE42|nr:DOPA 4,5-dioxygenase family protein [Oceanimonas marisflavi]